MIMYLLDSQYMRIRTTAETIQTRNNIGHVQHVKYEYIII